MAKHEVLKALEAFLTKEGRESAMTREIVPYYQEIHERIYFTAALCEVDKALQRLKKDGLVQHFPERRMWGLPGRLNR